MSRSDWSLALVAPRYAPAIGGVERHVEMLAQQLLRQGLAVHLFVTDPGGGAPRNEVRQGVPLRRFSTIGGDDTYYLSPGLGWWLMTNARRFTLLHAHCYHTLAPLFAALAARRTGVPLVITTHYHGTGHSPFRRALHIPYRLIGKWLLRQAELVICVSTAEEQLLRSHFGSSIRTVVIPNGLDVQELRAAQPAKRRPGRHVVLSTGRLERYKQVDRLVAAVPHLPLEFDVVIVGSGPAMPMLRQAARDLGVESRISFLGSIPRPELAAWYRSADVFVTMSREEAFGLVALEAIVGGARVLASDIPAHREVAGNLPEGAISLIDLDVSAPGLARAVVQAQGHGAPEPVADGAIPSWQDVAHMTAACYRYALAAAQAKRQTPRLASAWSRWRDWRLANR